MALTALNLMNRRPRGFSPWRHAWLALLCVLGGCDGRAAYQSYSGETMGTYYRVTSDCALPADALVAELASVNAQMSNYDAQSTLSRLNAMPPGQWLAVEPDVYRVLAYAAQMHAQTEGAFDVTVAPVLALWGFGPDAAERSSAPDAEQVAAALARVDGSKVALRAEPPAARRDADVAVDLSAIAKGHGVDRLVALLVANGCQHLLVDIGGEVRAQGQSASGRPWRIGIEVPDATRMGAVQQIVNLRDQAIATSGDYRNFVALETAAPGQRAQWSHTIDPRTGAPVSHGLASVSVIAQSAMEADALATALNVMGPAAGYAFAEQNGVTALFIERTAQGFVERYTEGFRAALEPQ